MTTQPVHNNDAKFSGYHAFFMMVFKSLLDLFDFSPEEKIVCTMKLDKDTDNPDLIVIKLELPQKSKSVLFAQNRIKMACSLLNEMGKAYRVLIKPESVNETVNMVQIIWQSMDEKRIK